METQVQNEADTETPRLAVVIPMYKAEAQIGSVIRGIPAFVQTIVVVDDCSPDGSSRVVTELADPRVDLVALDANQGVGGATMAGYRRAAALGADVLIKMDADGQMDPAALPALLGPILRGEADYTKGNRFLHATELVQMPLMRRFGNLGLSFLTKLASGYWRVFDPTNGYTALHASLVDSLDERHIDRRYFFETSLLLELSQHRAVVRDVFIPAIYGDEQSHLSEWKALIGFPPRQLRGFRRRIWTQHFLRDFGLLPVFLTVGSMLFAAGLLFGIYQWLYSWQSGVPASTGTVMLSVLPIMVGVQLILQAIVLDVQGEPKRALHQSMLSEAKEREYILPVPEAVEAADAPVAKSEPAEQRS